MAGRSIRAVVGGIGLVAVAVFSWPRDRTPQEPLPPSAPEPTAVRANRPRLPAPLTAGSHRLVGKVEDGGGQPVARVVVTASPESGDVSSGQGGLDLAADVSTVTNERGEFILTGLAEGHYQVALDGDAVLPQTVRFVAVPAGAITVVALRSARIAGVIVTGAGVVDGRATVVLESEGDGSRVEVIAGANGAFEASDLAEGRYRVAAFTDTQASPTVLLDRVGKGPFAPVLLALAPAVAVTGRVVDSSGAGLQASVSLASTGDEMSRRAISDAAGNFTFAAVRPGRWRIRGTAPGYVADEAVEFTAGSGFEPVLRLSKGARISGRVVDPSGRPVQGAAVRVSPNSDSSARSSVSAVSPAGFVPVGELGVVHGPIPMPPPPGAGRVLVASVDTADAAVVESGPGDATDASGAFEVTGLTPGRYRVEVTAPGYVTHSTAPLPLDRDARRQLAITLSRGVYLEGTAERVDGVGISRAFVEALARDGRVAHSAVADGRGRFRLGPVAIPVTVRASAPGFAPGKTSVEGPVETGVARGIVVELRAANQTLAGRVVDPVGMPVANARVTLESGVRAVASSEGRFVIEGVSGGSHEAVIEAAGFPALETELTTLEDVEVRLEPGGGVELLVLDAHTHAAVPGATVTARGPSRGPPVVTNARGQAEIAPLRVGGYRIEVSKRGYASVSMDVDVPAAGPTRRLSVRGLRVELEVGATVGGTVRDDNGERVPGASVAIGSAATRSDRRGVFHLVDAPAGDVELNATAGSRSGALPLTLRPGDEVLTLELTVR